MKKLFILLILGIMLLTFACNSVTRNEAKFTGAVEQLTQNEMLVCGEGGRRIIFKITPNTTITGDLRVGAIVTVVYNGVLTNSEPAIGSADKIIAQ